MLRSGELTLEQSAESHMAVGVNGFPHRYQRGNISYEMLKADSLLLLNCQLEWYRGVSASSSMEDGAFLFFRNFYIARRNWKI